MATVKVNFADVEDQRDFSPIPAADYHAMVTNVKNAEVKSGNNKGAPRLNWEFTVQGGDYDNRKVFDGHNLVKNQLWKPKALLKAAGFDVPTDEEFEFDPEDVVGSEVMIKVEVQGAQKADDGTEYKAKNNVRAFFPYEESDDDLIS